MPSPSIDAVPRSNLFAPSDTSAQDPVPTSGLFPAQSTASPLFSGSSPANQPIAEHNSLIDGSSLVASTPSSSSGSQPAPANASANPAGIATFPQPLVPLPSSVREALPSTTANTINSQQSVHVQTLDAALVFDAVFLDLPSLHALRPHWVQADLHGRAIFRLLPSQLADVLADIELSSGLRISTRNQRLTIARTIYQLIANDPFASPAQISAWDTYSLGLTLPSQALASPFPAFDQLGSATNPITSPAMQLAGSASQPLTIVSPPLHMVSPSGTIVLPDTPNSSQHPSGLRAPQMPTPARLNYASIASASQQSAISSSSTQSMLQPGRTRSVSQEYENLDEVVTQGPLPDEAMQELQIILPCGTRIYKERPPTPQILDWPMLYTFDCDAWNKFIVKYRRVNTSALPINSIPIVRRIDPLIQKEACTTLGLDHSHYFSYSNAIVERTSFRNFGPACASSARDRFGDKHFKFDDASQHQSTFASVAFRYFQEKLQILQDFTHVENTKWAPTDEFTHTMVIDAIIKCFPPNPSSSNNETIAQMIRDHRSKTLQQIQNLVHAHFKAIDDNVSRGQGSYHVHPTRAPKDKQLKRGRDGWTSRDGGNSSGRRGTSHDGVAGYFNTYERSRPATGTHERGVCCNAVPEIAFLFFLFFFRHANLRFTFHSGWIHYFPLQNQSH